MNEAGQVIGICIDHVGSYVSYQTVPELGFAIPISEAKTILDDLIVNGYVSGRVSLGLTVSEIPETYRRFWGRRAASSSSRSRRAATPTMRACTRAT